MSIVCATDNSTWAQIIFGFKRPKFYFITFSFKLYFSSSCVFFLPLVRSFICFVCNIINWVDENSACIIETYSLERHMESYFFFRIKTHYEYLVDRNAIYSLWHTWIWRYNPCCVFWKQNFYSSFRNMMYLRHI